MQKGCRWYFGRAKSYLSNCLRDYEIAHVVARADAYNLTVYLMASLPVVGLLCNLLIRAVHERHHMPATQGEATVLVQ